MALFNYMRQVQRFLRDGNQKLVDPADIVVYINNARREVAMRAQCVRVLPPISSSIDTATVLAGGTGYTAPTVQITSPDSPGGLALNPNGLQATATATMAGGVITAVNMTQVGSGYFAPAIQIDDPTGTGAIIQPNIGPILTCNEFQEVYSFTDINLSMFPGVESVYAVLDVSILYANQRYSVAIYSFPQYQALIRNYSGGSYYFIPCLGSQFGRGVKGSFYLYPVASQQLQLEFDCVCLPTDLAHDDDVEAIPDPWTDAVPYWAASLAFMELQNLNAARAYRDLFDERMKRFGSYALPGRAVNPYGRL